MMRTTAGSIILTPPTRVRARHCSLSHGDSIGTGYKTRNIGGHVRLERRSGAETRYTSNLRLRRSCTGRGRGARRGREEGIATSVDASAADGCTGINNLRPSGRRIEKLIRALYIEII